MLFGQVSRILPATNNTIWCLIEGRLVQFTDEFLEKKDPLPVHITMVTLDAGSEKNSIKPDTSITLKASQNQLHFEFSAPGFINEKQILYSYRLVGSNNISWSSPANEHSVSYASLQPGHYRFEVRTIGWNMQWGKITEFSFTITPPFWQTWWFYLLCAVVVALILYALYRYRIHQLLSMQKIRNRIAVDLHDDIGSTLTNISILSTLSHRNLQQPQQAAKYLQRISEEVDASGQALDDIIWSVNSKNDTLEEMLVRMRRFAAELFDQSDVHCKLELKETSSVKKMNMEQRRDIYLIYKESLNNIYKHAQAKNVSIRVWLDKGYLWMEINDDGKGFNISKSSDRNGLKNMHSRIDKWKGSINIVSEEGKGTSTKLKFPIT